MSTELSSKSPFATIEEAIEEIRRGRMVVVCDDEDRENEGDVVMAAQFVTPEAINFMTKQARGFICLALTPERCVELGLNLHAEDTGKGVHGGHQEHPALAAAHVNEGKALEVHGGQLLHDLSEFGFDGGLVEALAEDLAEAHGDGQARPGGVHRVVAVVVNVSEAAAAALGQAVLEALDELLTQVA